MPVPAVHLNHRIPFELLQNLDKYLEEEKIGKKRTEFMNQLIQIGFTVLQNKENLANPEFIKTIIENVEHDKIDDFFTKLEPSKLEAVYVFAKSEMEKRYGKSRLDKFV